MFTQAMMAMLFEGIQPVRGQTLLPKAALQNAESLSEMILNKRGTSLKHFSLKCILNISAPSSKEQEGLLSPPASHCALLPTIEHYSVYLLVLGHLQRLGGMQGFLEGTAAASFHSHFKALPGGGHGTFAQQ